MATLLIGCLLILTLYFEFYHSRKISRIFLSLTLFIFLFFGCGLFSLLTLNQLELSSFNLSEPRWGKSNAIIVLGAGSTKLPKSNIIEPSLFAYSRISEGAKLFLACQKTHQDCYVIVSGGDASKTGKSEASVYQQALLNLHVPQTNIILESNSLNTYKNAEYTKAILKSKSFDQVFLVTSGIHMKRALLYFAHFDIQATPMASDYLTPMITLPSGYQFAIADFILHEYVGILRFHVYNALGWNDKKS